MKDFDDLIPNFGQIGYMNRQHKGNHRDIGIVCGRSLDGTGKTEAYSLTTKSIFYTSGNSFRSIVDTEQTTQLSDWIESINNSDHIHKEYRKFGEPKELRWFKAAHDKDNRGFRAGRFRATHGGRGNCRGTYQYVQESQNYSRLIT